MTQTCGRGLSVLMTKDFGGICWVGWIWWAGRGGRSRGDDGRGFKLDGVMIHSHSIDHQKQTCVGGGGGGCRGGCRGERLGGSKGVGTAREESSGYDGTGDEKQGTRDLFI